MTGAGFAYFLAHAIVVGIYNGGSHMKGEKMRRSRSAAPIAALASFIIILVTAGCGYSYAPYSAPPLAFSGDSATARQTVVVPTLDTPALKKGKNVLWCATFQLCWAGFKPVVGPLNVPGADDTIRRLDGAHINASDMPKDGYYTAAGLVRTGIVGKIQSEMAAKFPKVKPNLPAAGHEDALAYAYLNAMLKFRTAYINRKGGDEFTDAVGSKIRVSSFGREVNGDAAMGRQIEILYSDKKEDPLREFVLDLDKNSRPAQLILACVEPRESLAATWREVQRNIKDWKATEGERKFHDSDSLVVPNLNYKIQHSFKELETSGFLKTGQSIDFRLDRSGAVLVSEAYLVAFRGMATGRSFRFTRPFLIAMRNRGSTEPYFVMWVDNAELLCKPDAH
ncbi:MAG: hypothetical protein PHU85_03805 [Phycisphaerae bacterium]|nr:hypothetical protein [Phycisphaerae bacterium]